jgi:hypothetical protein
VPPSPASEELALAALEWTDATAVADGDGAGLVSKLLRHARIATGRDPSYAVQWPDHPAAVRANDGSQPEMGE